MSSQIPENVVRGTSNNATYLVLGSDWATESFLGVSLDLEIDVSQEASYTPDGGVSYVSAYQADESLLRALWWCDWVIRRPRLWTVLSGITVT